MSYGDEMFSWSNLKDELVKIRTYYGTWREEFTYCYGNAFRCLDRRYWQTFFSSQEGTLERDGPVTFNGKFWTSENGKHVSYPYAVTDDYGTLVPVCHP